MVLRKPSTAAKFNARLVALNKKKYQRFTLREQKVRTDFAKMDDASLLRSLRRFYFNLDARGTVPALNLIRDTGKGIPSKSVRAQIVDLLVVAKMRNELKK